MLQPYLEDENGGTGEYEPAPLYSFHDLVYDQEPTVEEEVPVNEEATTEVPADEVPVVDDFKYPEYLEPEWIPPADATGEWYQEKYKAIQGLLGSEDLALKLVEANRDRLLEQEKDIENFKELYIAHKEGRTDFIRQNFPEELAKIGISPVLQEAEIDSAIESQLKQEFGENYADIFEQKDVVRPTSVSAKIFARSQELANHYSTENQRRQQLIEGYQPTQAEKPVPLDYDKIYEQDFKELPREEYDGLVNKLKESYPTWTLKNLLRVVTYEDDLAKAKEEGIRIGREESTKQLRTIGNAKPVPKVEGTEKKERVSDDGNFSYGRDFSSIMRQLVEN